MAKTHPKFCQVNFCLCLNVTYEPRNLAVRQSLSEESQHLALPMGKFSKKVGLARHHRQRTRRG
jgi:hypothetical protein